MTVSYLPAEKLRCEKTCEHCQRAFKAPKPRYRFCSRQCKTRWQWGVLPDSPRRGRDTVGICAHCNRGPLGLHRGLCTTCYRKPEIRNLFPCKKTGPAPVNVVLPRQCGFCEKTFVPDRSRRDAKFCCRLCYRESQRVSAKLKKPEPATKIQIVRDPETRKAIGLSPIGTCANCRRDNLTLRRKAICETCFRNPVIRILFPPQRRGSSPRRREPNRVCRWCKEQFYSCHQERKFCSRYCRGQHQSAVSRVAISAEMIPERDRLVERYFHLVRRIVFGRFFELKRVNGYTWDDLLGIASEGLILAANHYIVKGVGNKEEKDFFYSRIRGHIANQIKKEKLVRRANVYSLEKEDFSFVATIPDLSS